MTFIYSKTGLCRDIPIFLIFAPKHRLWVLVRTASDPPMHGGNKHHIRAMTAEIDDKSLPKIINKKIDQSLNEVHTWKMFSCVPCKCEKLQQLLQNEFSCFRHQRFVVVCVKWAQAPYPTPSGKHVRVMHTQLNPTFI